MTISVERLRELFDLDLETGQLRWRVQRGPRRAGDLAGTPSHGYIQVCVDGMIVGAHRVVWALVHGYWPGPEEVDHANRVRNHNRPTNLRSATLVQQRANRSMARNNTSGHKGVFRTRGRWRAQIGVDGKAVHLGCFDTQADAAAAYARAAAELFGEYASP